MPNARKVLRAVLQYVRKFGLLPGLAVGLGTLWPKVRKAGTVTRIRVLGYPHPVFLRARTSDVKAFHQVFVEEDHAIDLALPPHLIIDAGANVGYASVYFAHRFPGATVVAIEADQTNYQAMLRNVAFYPNIVPMNAAIWSRRTRLVIENPESEAWSHRVAEALPDAAAPVQGVGVVDVLAERAADRIDVLKLDVEGAELEVFSEGSAEWIEKVGVIMVELHDYFRPGCRAALDGAIRGRGFCYRRQGEYLVLVRDAQIAAG